MNDLRWLELLSRVEFITDAAAEAQSNSHSNCLVRQLNPQEVTGRAKSQSPLWGDTAAKNLDIWYVSEMKDSKAVRKDELPGLSTALLSSSALWDTYEAAKVWTMVTSQVALCPDYHYYYYFFLIIFFDPW